ncbi:hypothetical protein LZ554_005476 [Drepanopeziza brunnea f. sp. 'monogermtubi']|nr:hypothetical protein LZ554_005476 [Drepanopeziza brunnea f. sp. 'monogermtubi']
MIRWGFFLYRRGFFLYRRFCNRRFPGHSKPKVESENDLECQFVPRARILYLQLHLIEMKRLCYVFMPL